MRDLVKSLFVMSFMAACGQGQTTEERVAPAPQTANTAATEDAKVRLDKEVPKEILENVPKYLIQRTNEETGEVQYAETNEAPKKFDLTTEEGRLAFGKSEAERFARAKPVTVKVVESDEDAENQSTASWYFNRGFGCGGLGYGFGGYGFGYDCLGYGAFGGFGYGAFGLGCGGLGFGCGCACLYEPCFHIL